MSHSSSDWLESAKKTINTEFGSLQSLGFVLSNPKHNQLAMDLMIQIADSLVDNPYLSFDVYNIQPQPVLTDIVPGCGYFNSFEMQQHTGPLICFDPAAWVMANSVIGAKVYYYVYDINHLRQIPPSDPIWIKLKNTRFISRTKEHTKALQEMGITPIAESGMEMKGLAEIIYG